MKHTEQPEVRERLLATGLEIFATKGYGGATVREMSEQANSNIAAINYYFGDKEGFYKAVLEYARTLRRAATEATWEWIETDPWRSLKAQIERLLDDTFDRTLFLANWLFMRNLMDSDDDVNSDGVTPEGPRNPPTQYEERMTRLLEQLLGEAATPKNIRLLRYTYHSLCLFLPIHTKIERSILKGHGHFDVNQVVDKATMTDFIYSIVKRTVEDMQHNHQKQN